MTDTRARPARAGVRKSESGAGKMANKCGTVLILAMLASFTNRGFGLTVSSRGYLNHAFRIDGTTSTKRRPDQLRSARPRHGLLPIGCNLIVKCSLDYMDNSPISYVEFCTKQNYCQRAVSSDCFRLQPILPLLGFAVSLFSLIVLLSAPAAAAAELASTGEGLCAEPYGLLPCSVSVPGNLFLMGAFGFFLVQARAPALLGASSLNKDRTAFRRPHRPCSRPVLAQAANLISEGSELLLGVLGPGIVGGLLLPVLGARAHAPPYPGRHPLQSGVVRRSSQQSLTHRCGPFHARWLWECTR